MQKFLALAHVLLYTIPSRASPSTPLLDRNPFPTEGSEDEPESHRSQDGLDIDSMQCQREIAFVYFEKRNTIGADASRAMSHDWEQEASRPTLFLFSFWSNSRHLSRTSITMPFLPSLDRTLPSPDSNPSGSHELTLANHHLPLSGLLPYFPIQLATHSAAPCASAGSKATSSLVMVTATAKAIKTMKL